MLNGKHGNLGRHDHVASLELGEILLHIGTETGIIERAGTTKMDLHIHGSLALDRHEDFLRGDRPFFLAVFAYSFNSLHRERDGSQQFLAFDLVIKICQMLSA